MLLLACLIGLSAWPAPALDVRLAADTLTVHADRERLAEILTRLQEAGVRVAMDDRIDPLVSADFENRDVGEGIKRLLADCDYALGWRTLDGPAGKIRLLDEVLVYKPGDRRALVPKAAPAPGVALAGLARTNSIPCLRNELLLRLRPGTSQDQFRALLMKAGAMVLDGIPALGLFRLRLPPGSSLAGTLNTLAQDPLVERCEPNPVYQAVSPVRTGDAAGADRIRNAIPGGGPSIAILDTGYTPLAAVDQAVVASLDATAPARAISDPQGHGTQMALIAAGSVTPMGVEDVTPTVPIIPVRTLDDNGLVSGFCLMQSMVFAVEHGARVISMSWGSPGDSTFFRDTIAYAQQQGAVLVAAAGNEPTGQPIYPAAIPDVLAVAALDETGELWRQSNYGPFVDLAAPSFAALPVGYRGSAGTYGGTSIATAYTAHLIAQYLAAHPGTDAAAAVTALRQSLAPGSGTDARTAIPRLTGTAAATYLKRPAANP